MCVRLYMGYPCTHSHTTINKIKFSKNNNSIYKSRYIYKIFLFSFTSVNIRLVQSCNNTNHKKRQPEKRNNKKKNKPTVYHSIKILKCIPILFFFISSLVEWVRTRILPKMNECERKKNVLCVTNMSGKKRDHSEGIFASNHALLCEITRFKTKKWKMNKWKWNRKKKSMKITFFFLSLLLLLP